MNVKGLEAGLREGVGHFHMRVDALLAQHGHPRPRQHQRRGSWRLIGLEAQMHMQAGVSRVAHCRVFGISALRVVALLADFPAHRIPDLVQVLQPGAEHRFGVAPHLDAALADFQRRVLRPGLANEMAEFRQAVLAQRLHDFVAQVGRHLNDRAQLFVEQRLEREFLAARADLRGPVLAVAGVHAAVADAIAL